MLVLSRRTVATLALAGGLSAVISLAAPISATADHIDVANALRAGGLVTKRRADEGAEGDDVR